MKRVLTQEELDYLLSLMQDKFLRYEDIIKIFNEKVGREEFKNARSLSHFAYINRLGRGFVPYHRQFKNQEEMDYLKELMQDTSLTWRDIGDKFWEKYRVGIKPKNYHKRLQETMTKTWGIRRPKELQNDGKFKNGNDHWSMPLGSEIKKWSKGCKDTYIYIKVGNEKTPVGEYDKKTANEMYKRNWRPKQVVLYEQYYNDKVDDNEIVIFLDGNNRNFAKNNLRKISRATNATLAKKGGHKLGKITESLIEVIETDQILKEIKND